MNYSLNTNAPDVLDWFKGKLQGYRYEHVKMPDGHVADFFISADGKKIVDARRRSEQIVHGIEKLTPLSELAGRPRIRERRLLVP